MRVARYANKSVIIHVGQWISKLTHPDVEVEVKIYAHQYYHHLLVTSISASRRGVVQDRDLVFKVSNNRGQDSEDIDFTQEEPCSGVNVPDLDWCVFYFLLSSPKNLMLSICIFVAKLTR